MIAGFVLRLWYAMGYPLNGDEAGVTLLQASGQANTYDIRLPSKIAPLETFQQFIQSSGHFGLNDVTQSLKNAGLHPPLYYFIVYWILLLFGNQSFTLQLFSIIISLASIPLIYLLGTLADNKKVGLFASLLLTVSPYSIIYSSMARPYPLASETFCC